MKSQLLLSLVAAILLLPAVAVVDAGQTQSLDGTWEIVFDPDNVGRSGNWHQNDVFSSRTDRREINVPSCWELTEKDYEGVAFYRRSFKVPADWEGKVVRLQFDAVNFLAEVWLNGTAIGHHEGGFTPFELPVDEVLKWGEENTLILRVAGPILLQDKEIDGVGPMETPQWRGAITGGIWQSVRLVATDDVFVDDVFIEPKISDDSATFHVKLQHAGDHRVAAKVDIRVRPADQPDRIVAGVSKTMELEPGASMQRWRLKIPNAECWSPDNPHLYQADVTVSYDSTVSDRWTARFGMREFTVRDKRFYLNNEPLYLKATFFEGVYPRGLAYPDSREMAIREIELAKECGFNMIRPWRKPPPPMWLDLCDEIGALTVGSLAIECMDLPRESAKLPGWVENEVRESILRDRNRACVVQWELFNELKRPVLMQMLDSMSKLARELDPTRLILDESGGWAHGANLFLPYESEPTKFNDIHHYPGPQVNHNGYEKLILTGRKTPDEMRAMGLSGRMPGKNAIVGLMTVFSELGYGSLPDLVDNNRRFAESGNPLAPPMVYHQRLADEHRQALADSGLDAIYPDLQQFCLDQQRMHGVANKRMIEAVRCNPAVIGYCIHALTAGDWIMGAGLLDLFRNPKTYAYEGTKAANQPQLLAIRMHPRNVYAEQGTEIEITGVNELDAVGGVLNVRVVDQKGQTVLVKSIDVNLASGITRLLWEKLDTKAMQGTYTVQVEVKAKDGTSIAENGYDFDVFTAEQLVAPDARIAVFDPTNMMTPSLQTAGIAFEEFSADTDSTLPVFVSRSVARNNAERDAFGQLAAFAKGGGTVVYLQAGGIKAPWSKTGPASDLLPVSIGIKDSVGFWTGFSHIVHEHPVFDGLPVNCMMGAVYENVWARRTLIGVEGDTVVGSIGFDFTREFELSKRHYYGPGDTWWGSDLAVMPLGTGCCILSQLRLTENLGKDPVADRILYNLIRFAAE